MDVEKWLSELSIEELEELAEQPHECDFFDCCEYGNYNECFNHSHVLCNNYEVYYEATKDRRT